MARTYTVAAMSDQPVLTERRDGVLVITLNRPEARNAVNLQLAEGVAAALDDLDGSDDVSVGILTGAGGSFCAGMDLKAFVQGERPWVGDRGFAGIVQRPPRKPLIAAVEGFALAGGFEAALACDLIVAARDARFGIPEVKRSLVAAGGARGVARFAELPPPKPLIAAVEGFALAGGFEVALACDLIVAARDARFGIPEVKRSLVAAGGALIRLPKRIPYHLAMELALTGDPVPAERGYELGVVNRLAEPGTALATARELAAAIARNGPLALDATKRIQI